MLSRRVTVCVRVCRAVTPTRHSVALIRHDCRELGGQRLFAGRDIQGTSLVTLSDLDGKPRLRLQVDTLGHASITFLDASGRVLRTIAP